MGINKVDEQPHGLGKGKALLSYALIAISFWLAFSAFTASRYIHSDIKQYGGINLYLSASVFQDARLAATIDRESQSLEFMVWEHERTQLSRQLSELLMQRININPFNGNLWTQLAYLQRDAGASLSERAWVIERAARLLKWNYNERSKISHYCIAEYAEFQKISPELCSSLILNLPTEWTEGQKAINSNVKVSDLRAAMERENAKLIKAEEQ